MAAFFPSTDRERRACRRAASLLLLYAAALLASLAAASWVTRRRQPVVVPKIVGLPLEEARSQLSGKGLRLKVDRSQHDERIPKDAVATQFPVANHYLQRGQTVHVALSKGPPQVAVPDLVGLSLRRSRVLLTQQRLRLGQTAELPHDAPRETVLAQVPPAGSTVEVYRPVNLLVSAGRRDPEYLLPDFRKRPLQDAMARLRPAEILVGRIVTEVHDDLPAGTVLDQAPPPGSTVRPGDRITLTVSARSLDGDQEARLARIRYHVPPGITRRVRIELLDQTGTRTLHNRMESGDAVVEIEFQATGRATAQVYLNNEFAEEIPVD